MITSTRRALQFAAGGLLATGAVAGILAGQSGAGSNGPPMCQPRAQNSNVVVRDTGDRLGRVSGSDRASISADDASNRAVAAGWSKLGNRAATSGCATLVRFT